MDFVELISEDGVVEKVPREALRMSSMLGPMMEHADRFPLITVTAPTLSLVVRYLNAHFNDKDSLFEKPLPKQPPAPDYTGDDDDSSVVLSPACSPEDDGNEETREEEVENIMSGRYRGVLSPFDLQFLNSMDVPTLIEVTKAANYLGIERLLDLCCRGIANQMRGLSTEAIRQKFGIKNDFTPEEQETVNNFASWADDF